MKVIKKICVIGLGYVGLPLAVEFSKKYEVYGIDSNKNRINDLKQGVDSNNDIEQDELTSSLSSMNFSNNINDAIGSDVFIITVPTPIDEFNKPDLSIIKQATKSVASVITKSSLVIYESTVYPGVTEDVCGADIEEITGFKLNEDFFLGYSPERINPGDKINTLTKIKKITSGSSPEVSLVVDNLYRSIIDAGTYLASSIKVAEAAKCLENTQRDVNISLMNELSHMCDAMKIDTKSVIDAASTKWNFINYKPGLVGGHCIGVDPYYLAYQSEIMGYYPALIHTARNINNNVPSFISSKYFDYCSKHNLNLDNSRVLILGYTFKENCHDIRNTKVEDLVKNILNKNKNVSIYDPYVDTSEIKDMEISNLFIKSLFDEDYDQKFDCIILAVEHSVFLQNQEKIHNLKSENAFLIDIKGGLEDYDWRL